jgi:hypothetical protein
MTTNHDEHNGMEATVFAFVKDGKPAPISKHKTVSWGPLCFSVAPVIHTDMLDEMSADLFQIAQSVHAAARDKWEQYRAATESDSDLKSALHAEYEGLVREYEVLTAWSDLSRVAHTFLTTGVHSDYLGDGVVEYDLQELLRAE